MSDISDNSQKCLIFLQGPPRAQEEMTVVSKEVKLKTLVTRLNNYQTEDPNEYKAKKNINIHVRVKIYVSISNT